MSKSIERRLKEMEEKHCVQCSCPLYFDHLSNAYACICVTCPDYGLLQLGIEGMNEPTAVDPKYKPKKKRGKK
jgi:hypothetical protein